eukprot:4651533-Alexandrium_andersonii.AAC.1
MCAAPAWPHCELRARTPGIQAQYSVHAPTGGTRPERSAQCRAHVPTGRGKGEGPGGTSEQGRMRL